MPAQAPDALASALRGSWSAAPGKKAEAYIDKFFNTTRLGDQISGQVEGNHGVYTVTIRLEDGRLSSACSCYIGKGGGCHHCAALAHTFLRRPEPFTLVEKKERAAVATLDDLSAYLRSRPLVELLAELRAKGITQKAFCEAIGMNPRHLSTVRSSEERNHFYNELGAIKLAVLWALENLETE